MEYNYLIRRYNSIINTIYGLADENGLIRYIGKTTNTDNRLKEHYKDKRNVHKKRWLNSMTARGLVPTLVVIEIAGEDWPEREKYWIAYHKQQNINAGKKILNSRRKRCHNCKTQKWHIESKTERPDYN